MLHSQIKNNATASILENTQVLKYGGFPKTKKNSMAAMALPLTSLIDAFSIIVIYLLIGTQSSGIELNVPKSLQLPVAKAAKALESESSITLRIENGTYSINNQAVSLKQLVQEFTKNKNEDKKEIYVQADKNMDFALLDPVLKAAAEAGLENIHFAVIPQ